MKKGADSQSEKSNASFEMTHQQKYQNLIKRSAFKDFRDNIFRYLDYINTMAPSYRFLSDTFIAIVFFQQFIMALFPYDSFLWPNDSLFGRIFSVLTVVSFIAPKSVNSTEHFIVVIIIYALMVIFYILFFCNLFIFLKMSKINSFYVSLITIYLNMLQPYLINMISSHLGCDLHYIIENDQRNMHIATFIIGLLLLTQLLTFQSFFVAPSLTFRPQVSPIMYSRYSLVYNIGYSLIFFFTTFTALTDGLVGLILSYITILLAAVEIFISFRQHYWASIPSMVISQSLSISYCLAAIILPALSYFQKRNQELIVLIYFIIIVALHTTFEKLAEHQEKKALEQLENVSQDESIIEILSYSEYVAILRYGFENGHTLCHTWKLFEDALNKYEKDYIIVLMYARYAAIYTNESTTLRRVSQTIKRMKHNSIEFKHVLFQINSLLQHRERGLSKQLKKTLLKIHEKTQKCRGVMRYTWECVIRGNVVELETLSAQLKTKEEAILREYQQLFLSYPNNPYVASAFSNYLAEIMCDEKEANEKQRIFRLLRSGAWTRTEKSYYFAIRHIVNLPTADKHEAMIKLSGKTTGNENRSYVSSSASTGAVGEFDIDEEGIKKQKKYIETMVNSVQLPTTRYGPIVIIFAISLLLPIIIIPELIVIQSKMVYSEDSLSIIRSSALINLFMSHVAFNTFQYAMSVNDLSTTLKEKWESIYRNKDLNDLFKDRNYSSDIETDQKALLVSVEYLRIVLNFFNEKLPEFVKTGYFDEPLQYIFNSTVSTRIYTQTNDYNWTNQSMEQIITFVQMTAIQVAMSNDPMSIYDITEFWQVVKNAPSFYHQNDKFQQILTKSLQNMLHGDNNENKIIVLCSMIPGFLISIFMVAFLIIKMKKEKHQLFKCFRALPKQSVSAVVQQLNEQSGKEKQENEQVQSSGNAQEENAIRVLSTSVDRGMGWAGRYLHMIIIIIIFSLASIAGIVILCIMPSRYYTGLVKIAPLYHDIQMIHTMFMTTLLIMNRNALYNTKEDKNKLFPYESYPDDFEDIVNVSYEINMHVPYAAHVLRFGDKETESEGISFVGGSLIDLLVTRKEIDAIIPMADVAILEFSSYDVALEFINRMYSVMVINLRSDIHYYYLKHKKLSLAASWLMDTSYRNYVLPSFDELDAKTSIICKENRSLRLLLPIIIIVIVMVICGIALTPIFLRNGEIAKWTLKLLLFVDPNVVLQSKVIMKILSNDFSEDSDDKDKNKVNFYESVVSNLLDGVIFMSNDLVIRSANHSISNVIGKDPHKIIGMSLKDLFESPPEQDTSLRSFYQAVDGMMNCMRSPSIEMEVVVMKDNEPITLLLSMTAISANGEVQLQPINSEGLAILVLSIKDMTSTVIARTLLQEENAKNKNLLSMILPPIIVSKLQRGEENICFPVQSASIVFMDIVSFTPWCGSNTAVYVMSTLNKLFLYFDLALKKLDRMTKIKCIGDCYMCAGGIFDEVNQPAGHAKQAITFGLEAIKCVERIDVELNETLRIRVGCNTGGPIVAGVLGIKKPTFDILGPDINLGAMMEHHGVPMNVHIPQHVYDLGMEKYFMIKERGDVDVKGKMYHTFVVTGYSNQN